MKLEFEKWIEETKLFSNNGEVFIKEGIMCFKMGAYRGAFILSYLAFKISLRDKLLTSNKINSMVKENKWKKKIMLLENEEEWEKQLDTFIFYSKEDFKIFELTDDLRKEYTYWRKKKNDCVHGKEDIFSQATVQMFWDFLKVNFVKFQVLGEKEYFISQLYKEFRYSQSAQCIFVTLNQMSSLKRKDIVDILRSVDDKISNYYGYKYSICEVDGLDEFWKKIKNHNSEIQGAFLDFICVDFYTFDRFNSSMPELLYLIKETNQEFVNEEIIEAIYTKQFNDKRMWYYVLELLKGMSEKEYIVFIDRLTLNVPEVQPNNEQLDQLKRYGYFKRWKEKLFDNKIVNINLDGIRYIGNNTNLNNIYTVLDNVEWDMNVFESLEKVLDWTSAKYGRIDNANDYYKFIGFQDKLIKG